MLRNIGDESTHRLELVDNWLSCLKAEVGSAGNQSDNGDDGGHSDDDGNSEDIDEMGRKRARPEGDSEGSSRRKKQGSTKGKKGSSGRKNRGSYSVGKRRGASGVRKTAKWDSRSHICPVDRRAVAHIPHVAPGWTTAWVSGVHRVI
jgi:hypothetical protein